MFTGLVTQRLGELPPMVRNEEEEAGQRENVVAAVMGHSKDVGLTFGLYSKAEMMGHKSECVEAVKLPKMPRRQLKGAPTRRVRR